MATGVTKREVLSADALTAKLPDRDPNPLPPPNATPVLEYEERLSEAKILQPLKVRLSRLGADGTKKDGSVAGDRAIILADNLYGLHSLRESGAKVTLFYLDPPYNTGFDFQSRQLEHSYNDKWSLAAYIEFMRRRFILIHDLLTDDGSLYVHIDYRMLSHLKIVLDEIFGVGNCRNIITRRKCSSKNSTRNSYSNINDFVLFYTKTSRYKWSQPGEKPSDEWIEKEYNKTDPQGRRYKLVPIHAPGTRNGESGLPWRGKLPPPGKHWQYVPSKLDELDAIGEIHWSSTGNPRRKVFLTADKMLALTDYWANFRDAHHQSVAVTGYPTEKNLDMLRMIVGASSDVGDLVVDPFCGSGTTLEASAELGRRFVGIDQSFAAVKASITRLRHGSQPMGDYVERSGNAETGLDLFPKSVGTPEFRNEREEIAFDLLVDEEVTSLYHEEIGQLASMLT